MLKTNYGKYQHYLQYITENNKNISAARRLPLSEQKQIVDFLEEKNKQIDELTATEQRKVELLKEYRQSLISETGTGKIDVRNDV